ncbi:MAG: hypothetical protein WCX97_02185 [Candidatus Magasanikbacteria bacterium]
MLYSPKLFVRDWWINVPLAITVFSLVFIGWFVVSHINFGGDPIFLHCNVIFGVDLVGSGWKVLYLPGSGILIFLVNYFLALFFYRTDKFLSRLFTLITAILEIFLVVATVLIVGLNI